MKLYGESACIAAQFLTSTLDEGKWSASRFCRFIHRKAKDDGTKELNEEDGL
jgi:hypothetical protein